MTHDFRSDLLFIIRRSLRRPLVPLVTILTMGLSVAAVTAVFSTADAILLKPLPLPDSGRIVRFYTALGEASDGVPSVNLFDLRDIREEAKALTAVSAYQSASATWRTDAGPRPLSMVRVGPEYADVIGLPVLHGRRFAAEEFEPGGDDVAIATFGFWQNALGGEPDAVGRTLNLDGRSVRVVGILPDAPFLFPADRDLWRPLAIESGSYLNGRQSVALGALGRVAGDRAVSEAQTELAAIDARLRQAYPETSGRRSLEVRRLADVVAGPIRPTLILLGAAVLAVLLIAAANVADLLLGDAMTREREFALRAAIGGASRRLTRQVLVESLMLAGIGGAVGVALSPVLIAALIDLYPVALPRTAEIGVDARAFLVALAATTTAGLLAAVPLIRAAGRRNLLAVLQREGGGTRGRRSRRLASSLVVVQVAASVALLFSASLLLRGFVSTARIEPGYDVANALTFRVLPSGDRYAAPLALTAFYDELVARLSDLPGVRAAGITGFLPLSPGMWGDDFARVGTTDTAPDLPSTTVHFMTPDLPRALGLRLAGGRTFTDRDTAAAPLVVVVNEVLAHRYFDGAAVGREIVWMDQVRQIVGVVGDKHHAGLHEAPEPELYVPFAQFPRTPGWVVLRTEGPPLAMLPAAERVLRDLDPYLPATGAASLEAKVADAMAPERFRASLAAALGGAAAFLAALGLYGVLTHAVTARTRELGLRMALGATAGRLQRGIVSHALRLTGLGLVFGVVVAIMAAGWLQEFLPPGQEARDPLAMTSAAVALAMLAGVAAWLPARRASRVDPLVALKD